MSELTCTQCGKRYAYDDEVGYSREWCGPLCHGKSIASDEIKELKEQIQSLTQQLEDRNESIKAIREAVWQAKNGFSLSEADGYIDDALELLNELVTPSP